MKIDWLKIKEIVVETPEVKSFYLERPADFFWEEGSFTHIGLKGFNEGEKPNRGLVRHMSINNLPSESTIGFTTRIKENCSEYKARLNKLQVGDEVAMFKTHINVPLRREEKPIYFLSAGVGLATFRPIVLQYFSDTTNVPKLHSLNIDSTEQYLFTDVFTTNQAKNFTADFVSSREQYYKNVEKLTEDKEGVFYIVGSDEFLLQNIDLLRNRGIPVENIMIDKREGIREEFFKQTVSS